MKKIVENICLVLVFWKKLKTAETAFQMQKFKWSW